LPGRIVRGVLVLLLFELCEDIAERRFILLGICVPESVIDLVGLLHENARFRIHSGTPVPGVAAGSNPLFISPP
jgi:hypothetical protein